MNKHLSFIFLCFSIFAAPKNVSAMQLSPCPCIEDLQALESFYAESEGAKKTLKDWRLLKSLRNELTTNIHTCAKFVAKKLGETLDNDVLPEKIALVVDIDDTCILSEESYYTLAQRDKIKISPYDANKPPTIEAILQLVKEAKDNDITVYYLTARLEKLDGVDQCRYYQQELKNAGYPLDQLKNLICRPEDLNLGKDEESAIKKVGQWKQEKLNELKKTYSNLFFIDDQASNIAPGSPWQFRIPSVETPWLDSHLVTTPGKSIRRVQEENYTFPQTCYTDDFLFIDFE